MIILRTSSQQVESGHWKHTQFVALKRADIYAVVGVVAAAAAEDV